MTKMTIQELQRRQAWTLHQKIDHAVGTIENFIATTGHNVYVSFSGGKDSTILLDIARKYISKDINAVFCNTGNEYPIILRFVKTFDNLVVLHIGKTMRDIIKKEGFPLVSKETSEKIRQLKHTNSEKLRNIRLYGYPDRKRSIGKCPKKWQFLKDAPFDISERCCDELKKKQFKIYEKKTGLMPLIGVTAAESRLRTMQYLHRGGCNAFKGDRPRSFPLSIWTERDIYEYAKEMGVKLCDIYKDRTVRQTGCMMCGYGADQDPEHFTYLYQHYPKAYEHFMNMENNGVTYREALKYIGVKLPDE